MNRQVSPIEILLVEDNEGDIELTKEAFAESKVSNTIHTAMDGEQALRFLYRQPPYQAAPLPDVVLLDINLPKIDGREVLETIKNDPVLSKIPVVMLTSSDAERDIIKSYQMHANCYVTKPVNLEKFLEVVRSVEEFWLSVVKLPTSGMLPKRSEAA